MEDAGEAKADRETATALEKLPKDVVFDYDPEYFAGWNKMNAEWRQLQYKMEWSSSRIVGFDRSKNKMEPIYKLMECSRCFKICPVDSKACDEGHMICPSCANEANYRCPLEVINEFTTSIRIQCDAPVSKAILPIYDQLYEFLVDKGIVIRCENQTLGCPELMREEAIWIHQSKCPFRADLACNFDDCFVGGLTGPQLIEHFVQCHEVPLIKDNHVVNVFGFKKLSANTKSNSWTLAIFFRNNIHFFLCMAQHEDEDKIYIWVSTLEEELKEKYFAKISLKDNDGTISSKWEVVPLPFRIFNSGHIKNRRGVICQELKSFMSDFVWNNSGSEQEFDGMPMTMPNCIKVEIFIQTEKEQLEAYRSNFICS